MLRILIGHLDTPLPDYDHTRFDIRVVRHGLDGQTAPRSIAEMLQTLPSDWAPDIYYHAGLVHFPVPVDIDAFDGLTATNVQDWHRGGRSLWATTGLFDLIVTERNVGELLQASGYKATAFARFWGIDPEIHRLERDPLDPGRDIDILFIGSLNPSVWEERNRWIDRIARLSDRYRVLVTAGHYGEEYCHLTNRARIVFNRSVNGCTNQRAYDGSACGALVFNESTNQEVREAFEEDVHCVYYTDLDLEAKLAYWLDRDHSNERRQIVLSARDLVHTRHTEEAHQSDLLNLLAANLHSRHYRPDAGLARGDLAYRKALQLYSCALPASASSALDLLASVASELDGAQLAEARAALLGWVGHYATGEQRVRLFTTAIDAARIAVRTEPRFAIAHMTLGFLLLERAEVTQGQYPTGRNDISDAVVALSQAAERLEAALAIGASTDSSSGQSGDESTDKEASGDIDGFGYPRWSDLFDARIERAYLVRAIDNKEWVRQVRTTIAWRCRTMLAEMAEANGQMDAALLQTRAAVVALPEEPETLLALARREAMMGDLEMALHHYRVGLAISPFACAAWPEITMVLVALGSMEEANLFVSERLKVIQAIPAFAAVRSALVAALGAANS